MSPQIAQAVVDAIAADTAAGSQIAGNPGWAIGQALRSSGSDVFGAYLNQVHPGDLPGLRLGKKTDALVAEAERLHKQLDRYAYGPPVIRFTDAKVDQARAAGVLIELERGAPIICDRGLYRELCKQAIAHRRGPQSPGRGQGHQLAKRGEGRPHLSRSSGCSVVTPTFA